MENSETIVNEKKRSVILVCRALVPENYPPFDIDKYASDKYASDDCEPILIDLTPDSENIPD